MSIDNELVTIGIALLGIILGTWAYLHGISKKLDKLLLLMTHSPKKKKDTDHTNSIQTDNQHSFTNAITSYVKKCINNLVKKIAFYNKKCNWLQNIHQVHYTTKQLRFSRTS